MKSIRSSAVLVIALAFLPAACASARARSDGSRSDRLTREQIMDAKATDLYDVVQRLRPRWLTLRDKSMFVSTEILVYQDQTYLGGVDSLRQMSPDLAYELRYLDGPTASSTLPRLRSGGQHVAGAIIISVQPPSDVEG